MATATRQSPAINGGMTISSQMNAVKVVLRIRPPAQDDSTPVRFQRDVLRATSETSLVVDAHGHAQNSRSAPQAFSFDRVLSPDDGQAQVYEQVSDLISRFIDGFNVTIFCYGMSGSGKSYTMGTDDVDVEIADVERWGIIPRATEAIFNRLDQKDTHTSVMKNSYLELYNEELIDLLNQEPSGPERPQVQIREDRGGSIIMTGLTEAKVKNSSQIMDNLRRGSRIRQTGSTDLNAQSSRSHAIFTLTLTQTRAKSEANQTPNRNSRLPAARVASPTFARPATPSDRPASRMGAKSPLQQPGRATPSLSARYDEDLDVVTTVSRLHFVDLAGSERLKRTSATGDRVKEGISINAGLHALGNVISALASPNRNRSMHIPYRDSKLTRLLQDSLGGNAWTSMICCVSPVEWSLHETMNTLKYAERAKKITNVATIDELEHGWQDIRHLQNLVIQLRRQLVEARDNTSMLSGTTKTVAEDLPPSAGSIDGGDMQATEGNISRHAFDIAMGPVVEEYERSVTGLESQLALTKSALLYTEAALKDVEATAEYERAEKEALFTSTEALNTVIAKLKGRESTNEGYIMDLEAKMKSNADLILAQESQTAEIKKEWSRNQENLRKAEEYITALEARLRQDSPEEAQSLGPAVLSDDNHASVNDHLKATQAAFRTMVLELDAKLALAKTSKSDYRSDTSTPQVAMPDPVLFDKIEKLTVSLEKCTVMVENLPAIDSQSGKLPETQEDLASEVKRLREENQALLNKIAQQPKTPSIPGVVTRTLSLPKLSAVTEARRGMSSPTIPLSPARNRRGMSQGPPSFLTEASNIVQADGSTLSLSAPPSFLAAHSPGIPPIDRRLSSPTFSGSSSNSPTFRSTESLHKEISQLQRILSEREMEIRELEEKVVEYQPVASISAVSDPQENDLASTALQDAGKDLSDSKDIHVNLEKKWQSQSEQSSQQDILRSMARKEAAYQEEIVSLRNTIERLQVTSTHLDALTANQLELAQDEVSGLKEQLATATSEVDEIKQLHRAAQRDLAQHASQIEAQNKEANQIKFLMQRLEERHMSASDNVLKADQGSRDVRRATNEELMNQRHTQSDESSKQTETAEENRVHAGSHSDIRTLVNVEAADSMLKEQTHAQTSNLPTYVYELKRSIADAKEALFIEKANATELAQELSRLDSALTDSEARGSNLAEELKTAQAELQTAIINGSLLEQARTELARLRKSPPLQEELQEALDALSTMEKALLESTDEKEALRSELALAQIQLFERETDGKASLQAEILTTPSLSNTSSSDSETTGISTPLFTSTRFSSSKFPPLMPPPSSVLPPLPTAQETVVPGSSDSSRHSQATMRESITSVSVCDSVPSMDSKLQRRLEDHDLLVTKLTQQLDHCERDLRANIDMVAALQKSMDEAKRTISKGKVQIGNLAKERDAATSQCDLYKKQLDTAKAEVVSLRDSRHSDQERWQQEQRQKDLARAELQQRLDNVKAKKSKLNCF